MEENHEQPLEVEQPSGKVYVTLVTGKSEVTETYTEEEAKKKGLLDTEGYNLVEKCVDRSADLRNVRTCPTCGYTERNFEKTGRLGCPDCYETFKATLNSVLKRMHRGTQHVGKIPSSIEGTKVMQNRINYLEEGLQDAIRKEHFEEAAGMRDEIQSLREKSNAMEMK